MNTTGWFLVTIGFLSGKKQPYVITTMSTLSKAIGA
jgi:hypothetical protein